MDLLNKLTSATLTIILSAGYFDNVLRKFIVYNRSDALKIACVADELNPGIDSIPGFSSSATQAN